VKEFVAVGAEAASTSSSNGLTTVALLLLTSSSAVNFVNRNRNNQQHPAPTIDTHNSNRWLRINQRQQRQPPAAAAADDGNFISAQQSKTNVALDSLGQCSPDRLSAPPAAALVRVHSSGFVFFLSTIVDQCITFTCWVQWWRPRWWMRLKGTRFRSDNL